MEKTWHVLNPTYHSPTTQLTTRLETDSQSKSCVALPANEVPGLRNSYEVPRGRRGEEKGAGCSNSGLHVRGTCVSKSTERTKSRSTTRASPSISSKSAARTPPNSLAECHESHDRSTLPLRDVSRVTKYQQEDPYKNEGLWRHPYPYLFTTSEGATSKTLLIKVDTQLLAQLTKK
jgi:hypothetical protein